VHLLVVFGRGMSINDDNLEDSVCRNINTKIYRSVILRVISMGMKLGLSL
jgi:hypothetical protein